MDRTELADMAVGLTFAFGAVAIVAGVTYARGDLLAAGVVVAASAVALGEMRKRWFA